MKTPETAVILKPGEEDRLRRGHPWIYSNEIGRVEGPGEPGSLARLISSSGEVLGLGHYNPRSKIAFRFLDKDGPIDLDFFLSRLREALEKRQKLFPGEDSYRLCFGESDGLPGLVLDRYEKYLSAQILSAGMERSWPLIEKALLELVQPEGILLRNDNDLRKLEGLEPEVRTAYGSVPEKVQIREWELSFWVPLKTGQKTGFYFDQRQNRDFLSPYFKGLRVLDLYCYLGAFSLKAAKCGARLVMGMDSSSHSLALARENARLNGLNQVRFEQGDAAEFLKEMAQSPRSFRPDMILLDPPSFARHEKELPEAKRAYSRLFAKALKCLNPGGYLAASTCSRAVTSSVFKEIILQVQELSRRRLEEAAFRIQSEDHPVHPSMPETEYLHFGLFKVLNLSLALFLAFAGCRTVMPRPDDPGRLEGWVYRQDFFGLTWKLPEEVSIESRALTRKALKEGAEFFQEGPVRSAAQEGLARFMPLLTLHLEAASPRAGDEAAVIVGAERVPEAYEILGGAEYLRQAVRLMEAGSASVNALGPAYRETIGGVPFDAQDFEVRVSSGPGGTTDTTLYVASRKGHAMVVSAAYSRPEGLSRARAVLAEARFDPKGWAGAAAAPQACAVSEVRLSTETEFGNRSFEEKDYAASLQWYRRASEKGDGEGQMRLAYHYENGLGLARDYAEAAKLYRLAARGGHGSAQARLGFLHLKGLGVPQNDAEAARWIRKAAENCVAWAQETYGSFCYEGTGVRKDYAEAARWFRRAAASGSADAMNDLAAMYNEGHGVKASRFETLGWLGMAAAHGSPEAMNSLGKMSLSGLGVPRDSTAAFQWFSAAAERGDLDAAVHLADLYDRGVGVSKDLAEAARWYLKAAEGGRVEAQYQLGVMFLHGEGVQLDASAALGWLEKAARQGHVGSQERLAAMYLLGSGVKEDPAKALEWNRKAAENGSADSQHLLALAYLKGEGVPRDYAQAAFWFRKAAESGLSFAQWSLAELYRDGKGVGKDPVEAYAWFSLAAAQGLEKAAEELKILEAGMSRTQIARGKDRAARLKKQR